MTGPVYQFGDFHLNAATFELQRDGESVRLERKPIELLILLASSNGAVLSRSEIARKLWGKEVFVDTEHGINTAVRKVRAALRDDPATPHLIQTVPKVGYRFLQPVSIVPAVSPSCSLVVPSTAESLNSPADASEPPLGRLPGLPDPPARRLPNAALLLTVCASLASLGVLVTYMHPRQTLPVPTVKYEQLTDLADSAVAPALSPEGRAVAFVRGADSFASTGPLFIKSLPDGEIRQLTVDSRHKYGLEFSPDGSEIAYTVFNKDSLATYTVPVAGGDPHLLLGNSSGLTWLDPQHLLYSEVRSGIHLGVVTATTSGEGKRDIYFPAHQRGMAHYAYASPDRQLALVVEMDKTGGWAPCRLITLTLGTTANRTVGPEGACTAAAWSPDGTWMYFTAIVDGQSHLWRQSFPHGVPEQVTFGAAEEEGIAVESSGNALITSIGTKQSTLWIHDKAGDRRLSTQGDIVAGYSPPLFRDHDNTLYYLLRREVGHRGAELWRSSLTTGKAEVLFPGYSVLDFDVSSDGRQVVFSAKNDSGVPEFWIGPADQTRLPVPLGVEGGNYPRFGPGNEIVFQVSEGKSNYLESVSTDGSRPFKVIPQPIARFEGVSPAHRWAFAVVSQSPASPHPVVIAVPFDHSSPRMVCNSFCEPLWSSDGRFLVFPETVADRGAGKSTAVAVAPGEELPLFLPGNALSVADVGLAPGAKMLPRAFLIPGENLDRYAFIDTVVHRNLFRLTLAPR